MQLPPHRPPSPSVSSFWVHLGQHSAGVDTSGRRRPEPSRAPGKRPRRPPCQAAPWERWPPRGCAGLPIWPCGGPGARCPAPALHGPGSRAAAGLAGLHSWLRGRSMAQSRPNKEKVAAPSRGGPGRRCPSGGYKLGRLRRHGTQALLRSPPAAGAGLVSSAAAPADPRSGSGRTGRYGTGWMAGTDGRRVPVLEGTAAALPVHVPAWRNFGRGHRSRPPPPPTQHQTPRPDGARRPAACEMLWAGPNSAISKAYSPVSESGLRVSLMMP